MIFHDESIVHVYSLVSMGYRMGVSAQSDSLYILS